MVFLKEDVWIVGTKLDDQWPILRTGLKKTKRVNLKRTVSRVEGNKKVHNYIFLKKHPENNMLPLAGIETGTPTMTALESGYGGTLPKS